MDAIELTCELELGQGGISALGVVGKHKARLLAAIHRRLWIYAADSLDFECQGPAEQAGPITCLSCEPRPAGREFSDALFATGSADGCIQVWRLDRKSRPLRVAGLDLDAPILDLSWSCPGAQVPRGNLAASLADGSLVIWRPDQSSPWRRTYSDEALHSVDWFPDALHLAAGGEDGLLRVIQWPDGAQAEGGLFHHYNAIEKVRISACGRYVATISGDEKAGLFDLARRENRAFGPSGDPVRALGWHPAKAELVLGTQGGLSMHYDAEADRLSQGNGAVHKHPVEAAVFDPAGDLGLTGGREGWLQGHRMQAGAWSVACHKHKTPCGYVLSLGWLDDDNLAAGHSDGWVCTWESNPKTQSYTQKIHHNHDGPVYGLAVQPGGRALASGAVDKRLRVYDLPVKKLALDLKEVHTKPIYGVSFSPDGRHVATGSGDTYLVVYDVKALEQKAKERFGAEEYWHFAVQNRVLNCVAWSPAGDQIAVGLSNHQVVILPVDAHGQVRKGPTLKAHSDSVSALAWEPDGAHLWSAGYDKRLVRWRASDWQAIAQRLIDEGDPLQALAVHPDGGLVATGDWASNLRIFDAELKPLGCWRWPHYNAVEALAFHADGQRLASASSDGLVCIWRIKRAQDG